MNMSDNYSFRSAVNGFNRSDVINYISGILDENKNLKSRVSELEDSLAMQKVLMKNTEAESVKEEKPPVADPVPAPAPAEEPVKKVIEKDSLTEQMRLLEEKYDARLGAAMMDAKRFSDLLVKEANDKTAALFVDSSYEAKRSSEKAVAISEEIERTISEFNSVFSSLQKNMKAVAEKLNHFSDETAENSEKYVYTSQFTDDISYADLVNELNARTQAEAVKNAVPAEPEAVVNATPAAAESVKPAIEEIPADEEVPEKPAPASEIFEAPQEKPAVKHHNPAAATDLGFEEESLLSDDLLLIELKNKLAAELDNK